MASAVEAFHGFLFFVLIQVPLRLTRTCYFSLLISVILCLILVLSILNFNNLQICNNQKAKFIFGNAAQSAAQVLASSIQSTSSLAVSLKSLVQHDYGWPSTNSTLASTGATLFNALSDGPFVDGALLALILAPLGVVAAAYPAEQSAAAALTGTDLMSGWHDDTFASFVNRSSLQEGLYDSASSGVGLTPPFNISYSTYNNSGFPTSTYVNHSAALVFAPVVVSNAQAADTFGFSMDSLNGASGPSTLNDVSLYSSCAALVSWCFNATGGGNVTSPAPLRLWGFVLALVDLSQMVESTLLTDNRFRAPGSALAAESYQYPLGSVNSIAAADVSVVTEAGSFAVPLAAWSDGSGACQVASVANAAADIQWRVLLTLKRQSWADGALILAVLIIAAAGLFASVWEFVAKCVLEQTGRPMAAIDLPPNKFGPSLSIVSRRPANAADTPAERILQILTQLMEQRWPNMQDVMGVYASIADNNDIYQPLDLGRALRSAHMEDDVAQALLKQLGQAPVSDLEEDPGPRTNVRTKVRRSSISRYDNGAGGDTPLDKIMEAIIGNDDGFFLLEQRQQRHEMHRQHVLQLQQEQQISMAAVSVSGNSKELSKMLSGTLSPKPSAIHVQGFKQQSIAAPVTPPQLGIDLNQSIKSVGGRGVGVSPTSRRSEDAHPGNGSGGGGFRAGRASSWDSTATMGVDGGGGGGLRTLSPPPLDLLVQQRQFSLGSGVEFPSTRRLPVQNGAVEGAASPISFTALGFPGVSASAPHFRSQLQQSKEFAAGSGIQREMTVSNSGNGSITNLPEGSQGQQPSPSISLIRRAASALVGSPFMKFVKLGPEQSNHNNRTQPNGSSVDCLPMPLPTSNAPGAAETAVTAPPLDRRLTFSNGPYGDSPFAGPEWSTYDPTIQGFRRSRSVDMVSKGLPWAAMPGQHGSTEQQANASTTGNTLRSSAGMDRRTSDPSTVHTYSVMPALGTHAQGGGVSINELGVLSEDSNSGKSRSDGKFTPRRKKPGGVLEFLTNFVSGGSNHRLHPNPGIFQESLSSIPVVSPRRKDLASLRSGVGMSASQFNFESDGKLSPSPTTAAQHTHLRFSVDDALTGAACASAALSSRLSMNVGALGLTSFTGEGSSGGLESVSIRQRGFVINNSSSGSGGALSTSMQAAAAAHPNLANVPAGSPHGSLFTQGLEPRQLQDEMLLPMSPALLSNGSGTLPLSYTSSLSTGKVYLDLRLTQPGSGNTGAERVASVPAAVMDSTEELLARVDDWDFDTFKLAEVTQGHPLSVLAFFLFSRVGLLAKFRINAVVLARFLRTIESGYRDNPYHNATHAADVLRSVHVLVTKGGVMGSEVIAGGDHLALLACYMAAAIHDFEHKGCTNDFLVTTSDPLAIMYNDRSPMENHHVAAAFALSHLPPYNFLANLSNTDRVQLRRITIDMVMATDMKQHFGMVSHFNTAMQGKVVVDNEAAAVASGGGGRSSEHNATTRGDKGMHAKPLDKSLRNMGSLRLSPAAAVPISALAAALGPTVDREASAAASPPPPIKFTDIELSLVCQVALKCADLGHLAAPRGTHLRWVQGLEEEFFRQGDRERDLGLPVSPLFDRARKGISKTQVGFFDIVALPLFRTFANVFPRARPVLDLVEDNYAYWKGVESKAADDAPAAGAGATPSTPLQGSKSSPGEVGAMPKPGEGRASLEGEPSSSQLSDDDDPQHSPVLPLTLLQEDERSPRGAAFKGWRRAPAVKANKLMISSRLNN